VRTGICSHHLSSFPPIRLPTTPMAMDKPGHQRVDPARTRQPVRFYYSLSRCGAGHVERSVTSWRR
jgi:hypothetical protein